MYLVCHVLQPYLSAAVFCSITNASLDNSIKSEIICYTIVMTFMITYTSVEVFATNLLNPSGLSLL